MTRFFGYHHWPASLSSRGLTLNSRDLGDSPGHIALVARVYDVDRICSKLVSNGDRMQVGDEVGR
jgi:hypothetical protein